MTAVAAARRRHRRRRSSLVVHVHVMGGETSQAALTLMRVSVSQGSSRIVSNWPVLGGPIEGLILAVTNSSL